MRKAPKLTRADPARKQAVIYARVSSKEQEKEGFSAKSAKSEIWLGNLDSNQD